MNTRTAASFVFVFRLFVMSITDPISSVVAKPSKFPFLSCPTAALAPSIVIRRRRTCTRSGSRTSPAFACRRHSYSASLGFSAVVPCLVCRHAAEAGGKGVRWRAARGAAVAAAGFPEISTYNPLKPQREPWTMHGTMFQVSSFKFT